jgi:pimeloyl-ACP methyl ester carboxylesterase
MSSTFHRGGSLFTIRPASRFPAYLLVAALLLAIAPGPIGAQGAKKEDEEKPKLPAPQKHVLTTKDGVSLHCYFYPGTRKKESIPVMVIHGWEERGSQYAKLALSLQQKGHAVIVPDLRGHGFSTKRKTPQGSKTIRRDRMNKLDMLAMVLDLEACKSFLKKQNNAGLLNLEQLCLVGSDLGALVALEWSVRDWNAPRLPSLKQGQDVKGLVLISPSQSFKGLSTQAALAHPVVRQLSMMIISGKENTKVYSDARRIYNRLEKFHPKPPKEQKERLAKQDLFLIGIESTRQSADLLASSVKPNISNLIGNFVLYRLDKPKADYPWTDRTNPFNESN